MEQTPPNPFPANPAPSSSTGPLAAAVVIVVLLAAGGFYFYYNQQQKQAANSAPQGQPTTQSTQAASQPDSVGSMQADVNATQTTGGDADVTNLNNAL